MGPSPVETGVVREHHQRDPVPALQLREQAADVAGVDLVLSDGLRVSATLADGLWGLWWPVDKGDPTGSRLEVRTPDGVVTADTADLLLR